MKPLSTSLVVVGILSLFPSSTRADSLTPDRATPGGNSLAATIDRYIETELEAQGAQPAPQASPDRLVRRLSLDLIGRIPAAVEVQTYLDSDEAGRREQLVDRLIGSDEFNRYQAARLDWLITRGDGSIREYLTDAMRSGHGWDRIFRDVLLADLSGSEDAVPYLKKRVKDSERLTNDVSVTFFGVDISCAKCHDHPLVPEWTQDHYYGMKFFFDRTFDNGGFVAEREYGLVKYKTVDGEERQARLMFLTGTDVTPREGLEPDQEKRKELQKLYRDLKKSKRPPPAPQHSLRQKLVETALADGEHHFFAKSIVNRLWAQLFGYGLVMPLDQMHQENASSHPELLDWLAADLVENGYDLRRLFRGLVLSKAYSRTSHWEGDRRPPPELFAVASVRPLTPTQLARSLSLATADQSQFSGACREELQAAIAAAAEPKNTERFGQPTADYRVPAAEALLFSNGEQFQQDYLQQGLVAQLAHLPSDRHRLIELVTWNILSRAPADDEEINLLSGYLGNATGSRKVRIAAARLGATCQFGISVQSLIRSGRFHVARNWFFLRVIGPRPLATFVPEEHRGGDDGWDGSVRSPRICPGAEAS